MGAKLPAICTTGSAVLGSPWGRSRTLATNPSSNASSAAAAARWNRLSCFLDNNGGGLLGWRRQVGMERRLEALVRHGADDARREPDGVGGLGPRPGWQVPVYGERGGEDVGGGVRGA
jgi:hypothetical protein